MAGVGGAAGGEDVATTGVGEGEEGGVGFVELVEGAVEGPGLCTGGLGELFEGELVEAVVREQGAEDEAVGAGGLEVADLLLHAFDFGVTVYKVAATGADHDIDGLGDLLSELLEAVQWGCDAAEGVVGAVFDALGGGVGGLQQGLWGEAGDFEGGTGVVYHLRRARASWSWLLAGVWRA